uniref:Uncharacterized protein n=1 Tax=Tanacetum cinerariifolium TaxID=118510 RepID=A0A6L2KXZ4_TANCI|nr:hypothetical protein [Tanacetum cinerariifolium]
MQTKTELTLEQTQQGVSDEVLIDIMDPVKRSTTLPSHSRRSDTYAENPVKDILSNLNLPDHRSVLTEPEVHVKMEIPRSIKVKFITACSYSIDKYKDVMKAQKYVIQVFCYSDTQKKSCRLWNCVRCASKNLKKVVEAKYFKFVIQRDKGKEEMFRVHVEKKGEILKLRGEAELEAFIKPTKILSCVNDIVLVQELADKRLFVVHQVKKNKRFEVPVALRGEDNSFALVHTVVIWSSWMAAPCRLLDDQLLTLVTCLKMIILSSSLRS